ncbi:hypothetical protein ACKKBF_B09830 [Auxenochlorella protothecoides x Auxenochlorella symbiontica]
MASRKATPRAGPGAGGPAGSEDGVNIQVILRCRPPTKEEVAGRAPQVVKCNEALREITLNQTLGGKQLGRTYHFDRVFPGDTSQERLYDSTVAPLVEEMLEGFNCTIFAYGQTGTGKTYTMTGGDLAQGSAEMTDSAGVIPRAIHQVFSYLESLGAQEFTVKASYLELYNEEVTDLLALGSEPPKVRILEDRTGVVLNGLEEAQVRSASDIFSLLDQGTAKRRTAETLLNKQSSRSHTVFVITVSVREILAEGEEVIRVGKLYLVDLAGSENITRSGAVEQRAKEAGNINKSLLTLGRVITALVEGQGHVPYRDSKLTRLLRDSLGGRTKTCIIATIAPTVQCQEETLSTLEYAHRAKNIKNKPEINQKISKTTHLKEMNVEIEKLKLMLNATREKNGVYIPTAQYDEECEERKFLNGRVLELEEAAEASGAQHEAEKAELAAAAESQRQVLEQRLEEVEAAAAVLRGELEEAQVRIEERDHLILCQQRHEAALADHASRLTTELTAAAADLAFLFTRVEAKQALEDGNWEVVSGLRARLQERVATARTALEAGTARAAQATQEAGRMWGEEAARRAMRRERLAADEAEAGRALDLMSAAGSGGMEAARAAFEAAAEAAASARSERLAGARTECEASRARMAAAGGAAAAELARVEERLGELAGEAAAAAARDREGLEQVAAAGVEGLAAAAAGAGKVGEAAATASAASLASLEAARRELAEALAAGRAELLKALASAAGEFVSGAEARLEGAAATLAARIEGDAARTAVVLAGVQESATDAGARLDAAAEGAREAADAGAARLGAGLEATRAANKASRLAFSIVDGLAGQAADQAIQLFGDNTAAEDKAGSAAREAVDRAACDASEQLAAAAAAAAHVGEARHAEAGRQLAQDEERAAALQALNAATDAALRETAAAVGDGLAAVQADAGSALGTKYHLDAQKGAVPCKRTRWVPSAGQVADLRTPAHPQLLAALHAARGGVAGTESQGAASVPATQEVVPLEAEPSSSPRGSEEGSEEAAQGEGMHGEDDPGEENRDAGNALPALGVDLPTTGLKLPTVVSPGVSGVKRGRPGTSSGAATPVKGRASPRARVTSRRGTRRAAFEV